MRTKNMNGKIKNYFAALLVMAIVCVIFLRSFYWPVEGIGKRRVLVWMIALFGVCVVPVLMVKVNGLYRFVENLREFLTTIAVVAKRNKRKIISFFVVNAIGVGISWILTYLISKYILIVDFNIRILYTLVTLNIIFTFVAYTWEKASKKPEIIFAAIMLFVGVFSIAVTPNRVGVSWDDQIHYERTLEISNALNGIMYEADEINIANAPFYGRVGNEREIEAERAKLLDTSYETKTSNFKEFTNYDIWTISYIPSAIGIVLGRGLGLNYAGVFNMGRLFNLIMYTMLIFFAIRKIKYGKVLIATIGLIPTSIYMAASYSYDTWVTGFTILGFSYFFSELQDNEPLKNKNILIMIGAIMIGCMPKAIYFPFLFPLLFMPKKKFESSKQRRWYYLAVVGTGVLLVATFLLPILISGAGTGDVRGGADVNSTEQIKFILKNPLLYAKILLKFFVKYITLDGTTEMLDSLAYAGRGCIYVIVSFVLTSLAFLDRGEKEKNHVIVKSASVLGCAMAILLSATALYISFTAVASNTVAGMQGRYMIPTIFPALYSLGIGGTTHKINKNAFVCVPMLIIALTYICNMFAFCVVNY